MPTFDVHLFPVVRVKLSGVEAPSHREAIEEAIQRIGPSFSARFEQPDSEYAEEISHYLVDVADDPEFRDSRWFYSSDEPLLAILRRLLEWDRRGRADPQVIAKVLVDARAAVDASI